MMQEVQALQNSENEAGESRVGLTGDLTDIRAQVRELHVEAKVELHGAG